MTQLKFYNSLTRQKDNFTPLDANQVTMYSCGPTVYDYVHIGNLRTFITNDLLQRVLRHIGGYRVKWVMNITDVDDKMIKRAHELHSGVEPLTGLHQLADEYETKFLQDLEAVNISRDDISALPHATAHINHMQAFITEMVNQGVAYITEGSIYFSLEQYEKRGSQYGQLIDIDYDPKTRIDDQEQKAGAGDFALWKAAKPHEPAWDFDLQGKNLPGRPGWHIECSVMSTNQLGSEFDIHTGGIDLKFPHHENEIAQAGGRLARFWIHTEFLTVDRAKMAKSVGNITRLKDIENPIAFRLAVLSSHYRSQMDFSKSILEDAENRLQALHQLASKIINNPSRPEDQAKLDDLRHRFGSALADDLATPQALAILADFEKAGLYGEGAESLLRDIDAILGLDLFRDVQPLRRGVVGVLLTERDAARANQDWLKSDRLRKEITAHKVGLEDTAHGTIIWQE